MDMPVSNGASILQYYKYYIMQVLLYSYHCCCSGYLILHLEIGNYMFMSIVMIQTLGIGNTYIILREFAQQSKVISSVLLYLWIPIQLLLFIYINAQHINSCFMVIVWLVQMYINRRNSTYNLINFFVQFSIFKL